MAKKPAMGRGLDAIFEANSTENNSGVSVIRISDIEPNREQPRKSFDESALIELSQSIAAHGVIQPIAVRSTGDGFYKIIAGERRFRAAKMAGLSEIPAIVMELDEKAAAEVAIIENIQREDLTVIEEARAYRTLMDEYGMTQEEMSTRIGKSRSTVANVLRVLELPEELQQLLAEEKITLGHAKALMGLKYREDMLKTADETKVADVMREEFVMANINDPAVKLAKMFLVTKLPQLVICDDNGKVAGRVSLKDFSAKLFWE